MTLWFNRDMHRFRTRPGYFLLPLVLCFALACSPQGTATPFRPPTLQPPTLIPATQTPIPTVFIPSPTVTPAPTLEGPCVNDLDFLEDLTFPDDTPVPANSVIEKQWLVSNVGSCSWDSLYRLRWIGGVTMSTAAELPLFPAKAGTQAVLQINFTAPAEAGTYESTWQAYDPQGAAFGDPVYMRIVVTP